MKYNQFRAFEKHLQEAFPRHLLPVYLVLGKDDFARKSAVESSVKILLSGVKAPSLCTKTFNAQQNSLQEVVAELETFTFFEEKKIVVVHNIEKWVKGDLSALERFFSRPIKGVTLLLSTTSLAANTNLYKKIEKAGAILDLPEEKAWEKEKSMQAWLIQQAAKSDKKMDGMTAQAFVKQVGTDQATLGQELEKVICFIDQRETITTKDIALLCEANPSETIWQLGEALFRRDPSAALRISKGLLTEGSPFLGFLRQIRSQFQTEYQISCLLTDGGTPADVAQHFPYMKGAILEKHLHTARSYGKEKFKEALLAIDETELSAKSSGADEDFLNERLIYKLTL